MAIIGGIPYFQTHPYLENGYRMGPQSIAFSCLICVAEFYGIRWYNMVDSDHMVYKPTYNWGASSCMKQPTITNKIANLNRLLFGGKKKHLMTFNISVMFAIFCSGVQWEHALLHDK